MVLFYRSIFISSFQILKQFSNAGRMGRFKVLIANDTVPSVAVDILKTHCDVKVCKEDKSAIEENIGGIEGLFWVSYNLKLDKNLLDLAGPNLKAVATMSAGYDMVDVEELKNRGIKFGNTPGIVGNSVAEQAIMLALAAGRRLNEARLSIERSECPTKYDTMWMSGMEIYKSVIGIVGFGSIGQSIARKLQGFEVAKILYTGPRKKLEAENLNAEYVTLERLAEESDFIFACAPLTRETENLFNYELFSKMKKSTVFVNVGRGRSVNQPDLVRALRENLIFAAGLDCTSPEPPSPDDEIMKLPNCVLTPHLGTNTWPTEKAMAELAANNILRALQGEPMLTPVV